jgi:hypothetical protein
MKKTILLTLSPFLFGAIAVQAQTSAATTPATTVTATAVATTPADERTAVKQEELPAAVKQTLAADEYKGWETASIFWVKNEKAEYYEVSLKQADKVSVVKLNKDGKKVD